MPEGKLILYMIDHFSRMFIKSKKQAEVVNAHKLHWVVGRLGEFNNVAVTEMAERLGCCVTSTAGDIPHMNSPNEKDDHTVDRMYSIIEEDNPDLKHE